MAQVVECLPSKHKDADLSSNSNTEKQQQQKNPQELLRM
jgi:hypothetical protein